MKLRGGWPALTGVSMLFAAALIVLNPLPAQATQFYDTELEAVQDLSHQYQSTATGTSYVQNVTENTMNGTLPAYEKFELSFDVTNLRYDNPFDPDQVDIVVWFTPPGSTPSDGGGDDIAIPAFFDDEYSDNNGLYDLTFRKGDYTQAGTPGWKVRFSTGIQGEWQYKIRVLSDMTGTKWANAVGTFTVGAPDSGKGSSSGYVQVSKTNPMWFEHSEDWSLFYGSGTNIATMTSSADPAPRDYMYFLNLAQGNTSSTRIWLTNYQWLEWTPRAVDQDDRTHSYGGAGFYNQRVASSFDHVLEQAEQNDIQVMLTLDDNNERAGNPGDPNSDYDNAYYNPYLAQNGGPLANFSTYYTDSEVRDLYKQRLRYILARWGYSTHLWAINTFNDYKTPDADVVEFLADMDSYVHSITDPWRPIQFSSNYRGDSVDPVLDYAYDQNARETVKPNVQNETYYSDELDPDIYQTGLRMELWPSLLKGNAASMTWKYWMIEKTDSWSTFQTLLNQIADVPLNQKTLVPADDSNRKVGVVNADPAAAGDLDGISRITAVKPYGDIPQFGRSAENQFDFTAGELEGSLNNQEVMLDGYTDYLFGANYTYQGVNLHNPPTFTFIPPADGEMILEVLKVSGTNALLSAYKTIDGTSPVIGDVSDQADINEDDGGALPAGGYRTFSVTQYSIPDNEKYSNIPIVKDELTKVTLDSPSNNQWVDLNGIYFAFAAEQPEDLVTAKGLVGTDEALLYVYNQTHTELSQTILNQTPKQLKNVVIHVSGLLDGTYSVIKYDPATGTQQTESKTSSSGVLSFTIYSLDADKVVKIKPASILGGGSGTRLVSDSLNYGAAGDTPTAYSDPAWNWTVATDGGDPDSEVRLAANPDSNPIPALANDKYLRLQKGASNNAETSASKDVNQSIANTGHVVVEARVRPGKSDKSQFGPILVNSGGVELVRVNFSYTSDITVTDGDGTSASLLPYSANQWYDVRIAADLDAGTYQLWINDTPIDLGPSGRDLASGTKNVDRIKFKLTASVSNLHTWDIDNVSVVHY